MRRLAAVISVCALGLVSPSKAQDPTWNIVATVAESCSCTVACSWNFGSKG